MPLLGYSTNSARLKGLPRRPCNERWGHASERVGAPGSPSLIKGSYAVSLLCLIRFLVVGHAKTNYKSGVLGRSNRKPQAQLQYQTAFMINSLNPKQPGIP